MTRLWRTTKASGYKGWVSVHGPTEDAVINGELGSHWRPATRRERTWHVFMAQRFSWRDLLVITVIVGVAQQVFR